MKNYSSESINRASEGAKKNLKSQSENNESNPDWKKVLVDIILSIITLGLYHVEKHSKK